MAIYCGALQSQPETVHFLVIRYDAIFPLCVIPKYTICVASKTLKVQCAK